MREVGEGGINTKKAIINYHHRAAATGVGWGGVSLTKDQFVTAHPNPSYSRRAELSRRVSMLVWVTLRVTGIEARAIVLHFFTHEWVSSPPLESPSTLPYAHSISPGAASHCVPP